MGEEVSKAECSWSFPGVRLQEWGRWLGKIGLEGPHLGSRGFSYRPRRVLGSACWRKGGDKGCHQLSPLLGSRSSAGLGRRGTVRIRATFTSADFFSFDASGGAYGGWGAEGLSKLASVYWWREDFYFFCLLSLPGTGWLWLLHHPLHHSTFIIFSHGDAVQINAWTVLTWCSMGAIFLACISYSFSFLWVTEPQAVYPTADK